MGDTEIHAATGHRPVQGYQNSWDSPAPSTINNTGRISSQGSLVHDSMTMLGDHTVAAMAAIMAVKAVRARREARWFVPGSAVTCCGMIGAMPLMAPTPAGSRPSGLSGPFPTPGIGEPSARSADSKPHQTLPIPDQQDHTMSDSNPIIAGGPLSASQEALEMGTTLLHEIDASHQDRYRQTHQRLETPPPPHVSIVPPHVSIVDEASSKSGSGSSSHLTIELPLAIGGDALSSQTGSVAMSSPTEALSPASCGLDQQGHPAVSNPTRAALMMCAICGQRRAGFLNRACKHVGPCK